MRRIAALALVCLLPGVAVAQQVTPTWYPNDFRIVLKDGTQDVDTRGAGAFTHILVVPAGKRVALKGGGYIEGPFYLDGAAGTSVVIYGGDR